MTDEIVVIGAGIVGVSCARALQQSGRRVRILDPRPPGEGCSSGNAGLIAIDHVLPLARPDVLRRVPGMLADPLGPLRLRVSGIPALLPWLARFATACSPGQVARGTAALGALLRGAMPAWERAMSASGLQDLFRRQGALVVFEREETRAAAGGEERVLEAEGVRFNRLQPRDVRDLAPGIVDSIAGGRFYPDAAHVLDPRAVVTAIAKRVVAEGGIFEQREARGFVTTERRVTHVETDCGRLPAAEVVLAAGARSGPLAQVLGIAAPLAAERGYHVMVDPGDLPPEISLTFAERGFVATPMRHGLRLAGTVELGAGTQPDWRRAAILQRHLTALFPGKRFVETARWFGDRPTLPDYLPMIGRGAARENAIMALGHQHLGLTLAAVTAELVVDIVHGRASAAELAPFRPDRFAWPLRQSAAASLAHAPGAVAGTAP